MQLKELLVEKKHHGERLDVFVSDVLAEISRSRCKNLIEEGHLKINGAPVSKAGQKLAEGDRVSVAVPDAKPLDLAPVDLNLEIVFEDADLAIVNKPAHLSVHPSPTEKSATLVHGLLHELESLSSIGGVARPGIVHRIDKGTSGLLVISKTDAAHESLSRQFHDHTIERAYTALVYGDLAAKGREGTIATFFGRHPKDRKKMTGKKTSGRRAVTHWRVLGTFKLGKKILTLAECRLETGRTHQIRVHLSEAGFTVVGDATYGDHARKAKDFTKENAALAERLLALDHQLLHARLLGFTHPRTRREVSYAAPLPKDFQDVLDQLHAIAAAENNPPHRA